jgi:hypothetical protein
MMALWMGLDDIGRLCASSAVLCLGIGLNVANLVVARRMRR